MQNPSVASCATASSRPKEWSVENFVFIEHVAEGSYGSVYKAQLISTGEVFALKEISKAKAIQQDAVERIFAEKNIHLQLRHPNIIRLRGTFQSESCVYFVLEWADGGDLHAYWKKTGEFGTGHRAASIAIGVLEALKACHLSEGGGGILHRDLKPENILIDENENIKLADFGCACFVHDFLQGKAPSRNIGSAPYASPLLINGAEFDDKSLQVQEDFWFGWRRAVSVDLWSFGCLLYFLKHGTTPFCATSDYLTMKAAVDFYRTRQRTVLNEPLDNLLFFDDALTPLTSVSKFYDRISEIILSYFVTN